MDMELYPVVAGLLIRITEGGHVVYSVSQIYRARAVDTEAHAAVAGTMK